MNKRRYYAVYTVQTFAALLRHLQLEGAYGEIIKEQAREYNGLFVLHLQLGGNAEREARIPLHIWRHHAVMMYVVAGEDGAVSVMKQTGSVHARHEFLESKLSEFASIPMMVINFSGYPEALRVDAIPQIDPELWKAIKAFENQRGIRTVLVMRVGSRAWGYANAASDTDLILVYVQLPWKQAIDNKQETFREALTIDGEYFEVQGVELRKFVGMLARCDPHMVTTMHADMLLESKGAYAALREVVLSYMNRNAMIEALRGQAKGNIVVAKAKHIVAADVIYGFMAALRAEHLIKTGDFAVKIDKLQTSFGTPEDIRMTIEGIRAADEQRFCDFVCSVPGKRVMDYFYSLSFPAYPERTLYPDKRNKDLTFANEKYAELCSNEFYNL